MDLNPPPRRKEASSDLIDLRSLLSVLPGINAGEGTAAWGEIERAQSSGRFGRLQNWMAIPYPQLDGAGLGGLQAAGPFEGDDNESLDGV
jgi:hypothetical protein